MGELKIRAPVPARKWTQALHTCVWLKDKKQWTYVGKENIHFEYNEEKVPSKIAKW